MKVIAFYLPQYHPVAENNEWWGPGFTEWTNVAKSRPRYRGHYQPHIPADTGFYDLRCPESRELQATLASNAGIYGFCYYHYWFNGRRLLNQPIDAVLSSGKPTLPFCFCWANESWTRSWDGKSGEVLIKQNHSIEDDKKHIEWLLPVFKDARYIKINGRPLFLIYRTDIIPNISDMLSLWRRRAISSGFPELYVCAVRSNFINASNDELIAFGFDGIVDFQPSVEAFPKRNIAKRGIRYTKIKLNHLLKNKLRMPQLSTIIKISYRKLMNNSIARLRGDKHKIFPCVIPSWDNSPRKQDSIIIQNDDPNEYGLWLDAACDLVQRRYQTDENIVFINAWNEWGEGAHLEPDLRFGNQYLEITKKIISNYNKTQVK